MNKAQLVETLSKKTKLTKAQAEQVLDAALDTIQDRVSQGEDVKLVGFGTFSRTQRAARIGRNPKTGSSVEIPAVQVPKFKPGKEFKENVR